MARKKNRRRYYVLFSLALLLTVAVYFHKGLIRLSYQAYRSYFQKHQRNYDGRNLVFDFPKRYSIHGVDVSRWQDEIDWENLYGLKPNRDTVRIQFAFIKATEGILIEDPMFTENWKGAKEAGIIRGAYHYFKPRLNANLQAKNFISSVDLKKGDLPPVIDIEETGGRSKAELVKSVSVFVKAVEKEYGVKPILYSNIKFIEDFLADNFSDYKFWVAHYYVKNVKPSPGIEWLFWQHHDMGKLNGCIHPIDLNVFNGNKTDFDKIRI